MTTDLERLDDDLLALVRKERPVPALSTDRVRRARERLETRLVVGAGAAAITTSAVTTAANSAPLTPASATAKGLTLGKVGALVLLAFSGGAATGWATSNGVPPKAAPAPSTSIAAVATSAPPVAITASAPDIEVARSSPAPTAVTSRAPVPSATNNAGVSVATAAAERTLLDQARRALREGDGGAALELIGRHERDFPRGTLIEEREVLRVNALVSLGRFDEAKRRTTAFRKRFPTSPFLPALDSQLRDL